METQRWLLPFTHGVNMQSIDYAVSLAQSGGATLVAVSLISVGREKISPGARLEHIQQSKDFLEAVKWKAARYEVSTELYEVYTGNVLQSITLLIHEQHCEGIILVSTGKKDILLRAAEVKHLLVAPPAPLVLIRLPRQKEQTRTQSRLTHLLSWLQGLWDRAEHAEQMQDAPAVEGPLWIRTEEHSRG